MAKGKFSERNKTRVNASRFNIRPMTDEEFEKRAFLQGRIAVINGNVLNRNA
jgi:hypothetical protein